MLTFGESAMSGFTGRLIWGSMDLDADKDGR